MLRSAASRGANDRSSAHINTRETYGGCKPPHQNALKYANGWRGQAISCQHAEGFSIPTEPLNPYGHAAYVLHADFISIGSAVHTNKSRLAISRAFETSSSTETVMKHIEPNMTSLHHNCEVLNII